MTKPNEPEAVTRQEIEAYKWVYLSDFTVAEAASIMRISRQKVYRLLQSLKKKRPEIFADIVRPKNFISYCQEMDKDIKTKF